MAEEEKKTQEVPQKRKRAYAGAMSLIVITVVIIALFTGGIAYGFQSWMGGGGGEEAEEGVEEGVLVDGVREFRILARQWEFEPNVIKVNPGETVRFIVTSADIMHGFAIEELGINLQLSPDAAVTQEVVIPLDIAEGTYTMYCSVFCGLGHAHQKGDVIIGDPGLETGRFLPYTATSALAGIFAASIIIIGRRRAR